MVFLPATIKIIYNAALKLQRSLSLPESFLTMCSMTGYAIHTRETPAGTITIELKSVNSRFLDLQFRVNDELRSLEPALREAIIGRVVRGKVEGRRSFGRRAATGDGQAQAINTTLLATLATLQQQIRQQFTEAA